MAKQVALVTVVFVCCVGTVHCPGPVNGVSHCLIDDDGDGYDIDCPPYDCNDRDPTCHEGPCCPGWDCADNDGDWFGDGTTCLGLDCDDFEAGCHDDGDACCEHPGPCLDADGDGFGFFACPGIDCNETDDLCADPRDDCCISGTVVCGAGLECVMQCTEMPCYSDCLAEMDRQAQLLFQDLQICSASAGCGAGLDSDFWSCASDSCSTDLSECLNDLAGY